MDNDVGNKFISKTSDNFFLIFPFEDIISPLLISLEISFYEFFNDTPSFKSDNLMFIWLLSLIS